MNKMGDVTIFNFTGVYESEDFYQKLDNPRFIECKNIKGTDCLCDEEGEKSLRTIIDTWNVPISGIHFIDNGNYHYMSYIFASYIEEPFDLVYFDNHPDLKPTMFGDILSCGCWVKKLLDQNTNIRKVILVGANKELFEQIPENDSKKVTYISAKGMDEEDEDIPLTKLIKRELRSDIPLYISVDKDVLSPFELKTNWDQGTMEAKKLIQIIKNLNDSQKVLGIDICGEISKDTECEDYDLQISNNNRFNHEIIRALIF